MRDELKANVNLKILQFLKGQTLEKNKFEMKSKWYDLSWRTKNDEANRVIRNREYYEFLKDCTSIVNSFGGDDGFIVIGVDEKQRTLVDSPIENCGLNDVSKINNIIIGNIDQAFIIDLDYIVIEDKRIAVIHLQQSSNKPHAITEYYNPEGQRFKNEIFYRSGSAIDIANKSALDLMYWERKNIVLDKKIEVAFKYSDLKFQTTTNSHITLLCMVSIENVGTKNILMSGFTLNITFVELSFSFTCMLAENGSLPPNDPRMQKFHGSAFVNLSTDKLAQLEAALSANRKSINFNSFITSLSNHEELLSIPIVK